MPVSRSTPAQTAVKTDWAQWFPTPYWTDNDSGIERKALLYMGDVRAQLQRLPARSVQCCVTSPPYWGLRDYGTGTWEGGNADCNHVERTTDDAQSGLDKYEQEVRGRVGCDNGPKNGESAKQQYKNTCGKCGAKRTDMQLGSEPSPDCGTHGQAQCGACFVCNMVSVFREARRVLRDDGTCWLNLGDTYGGNSGERNGKSGSTLASAKTTAIRSDFTQSNRKIDTHLSAGNLVGVPWRVALALQADGWILRQDVIWYKPSAMPESVLNRCTKAHEYIFLLAKTDYYYYDVEAIREQSITKPHKAGNKKLDVSRNDHNEMQKIWGAGGTSNKRSVWTDNDHRALLDWLAVNDENLLHKFLEENRTKKDVWKVAARGYKGAHFACVDAETEALTKEGWKKHSELRDGEFIAAYNKYADILRWEEATIHRYPYSGNLVVFDKRDTSQWLTPNHRCLIQSRKGVVKVKEAQWLKMSEHFLMSAEMEEEPETSIGEDMASLVGWFTSEGHINYDQSGAASKKMACISQSVTANPKKVDIIGSILRRMNASYNYHECAGDWYDGTSRTMATFSIGGAIGWKLVNELCAGKCITDEMTRLPRNELRCLLNAFIAGDGCTRKDDGRLSIIQKDKRRLEQLQVIAIKLGYRALLTYNDDNTSRLYLTTGKWLNICGTNRTNSKEHRHYSGIVWCPSVNSSFWLARRDGKPFITGNTYSSKLITPCLLAGTSECGCCAKCGKPYVRLVAKGLSDPAFLPNSDKDQADTSGKSAAANASRANRAPVSKGYDRSFNWSRNGMDGTGSTLDTEIASKATLGWRKACVCATSEIVPCAVLDPFVGSGTTVATAIELGRVGVGIDLSEDYLLEHAIPRIAGAIAGVPFNGQKKEVLVVPPDAPPPPKRLR